MPTVRCSDHLSCQAHMPPSPAIHIPCHTHPCHACPPATNALPTMHAPCHTHTHALPCIPPCHTHPFPLDRILGTRLWKHYLSATTVEDGNQFRESLKTFILKWNICCIRVYLRFFCAYFTQYDRQFKTAVSVATSIHLWTPNLPIERVSRIEIEDEWSHGVWNSKKKYFWNPVAV